jgi:hypothetical protein
MKKTARILLALILVASPSIVHAEAVETPPNAMSLLQTLVPQIADQTADATEVKVSGGTPSRPITVTDAGGGIENSEVSFEIDSSSRNYRSEEDLRIIESIKGDYTQIVQPLSQGFRILNVLNSASSKREFSFNLTVPESAELEEVDGAIRVVLRGEILGQIRAPWALDALGNKVSTHYVIDGLTVTQYVDPDKTAVYPIVADPEWGYLYSYNLSISFSSAWNKVHQCFNCYFPVAGAPSNFPSYKQLLPLKAYIGLIRYNMECTMGYVLTATTYDKWQFWATKNHVDGAGSMITFEFRKVTNSTSKLIVDAWIIKDFAGIPYNPLYMMAANINWQNFANNLNDF